MEYCTSTETGTNGVKERIGARESISGVCKDRRAGIRQNMFEQHSLMLVSSRLQSRQESIRFTRFRREQNLSHHLEKELRSCTTTKFYWFRNKKI